MSKPKNLPKRIWVIYQDYFGTWEIQGTATSVEQRDRLLRHYDNIPGSGQTIWKSYLASGKVGPEK
jgi:hypothetical protein